MSAYKVHDVGKEGVLDLPTGIISGPMNSNDFYLRCQNVSDKPWSNLFEVGTM